MCRRLIAAVAAVAAVVAVVAAASSIGGCASAPDTPGSIERLRAARFVLLGEVHDNAEHHAERAALLRRLLADGRPTRVVFEQMPRGRDAALAAAPRDAEAVASAGGLDREAWRWPLHKPIVEAALAGGASVAGGNLARGEARAIARDGLEAAPADLRALIAADAAWGPSQQSTLSTLVAKGHCDALPPQRIAPMVLAQRAVDAALAQAMLRPDGRQRVVLVAGNGHVRQDVGVPRHLRAAGVPAREIVSVGFVESGQGDDRAPYDAIQESPPAERGADPCEVFRRR